MTNKHTQLAQRLHDWYEFSISWTKNMRTDDWNEICAWTVEQFGLPGDRYLTHPELDTMTFLFRDIRDYEWMILRWT
jgi:hypothetical protein